MHVRRLACLLVGVWLGAAVLMAFVAAQNFRGVDRVLAHPSRPAAPDLDQLGPERARFLLRYQVSELNRFYFNAWELAQLVLGLGLFFLLLFASPETKFTLALSLAMLAVVAGQHLLLTPEITALGRMIDYVPAEARTPERARFWALHGAYTALELAKWAVGLWLAGRLIVRHRHDRDAGVRLA